MTFDKSLRRAAQDLRRNDERLGVPPSLRSKVLVSLPSTPAERTQGFSKTAARLFGVALTVFVVAAGFGSRFLSSQAPFGRTARRPTPSVKAIDSTADLRYKISAAVDAANTWHVSRRIEYQSSLKDSSGAPIAPPVMETWGRQKPFFFGEQVGKEIVVDDGKKRYHLIPDKAVPGDKKSGTPPHTIPESLIVGPSLGFGNFEESNHYIDELKRTLVGSKGIAPGTLSNGDVDTKIVYDGSPAEMTSASSAGVIPARASDDTSIKTIENVRTLVPINQINQIPVKYVQTWDLSFDPRTSLPIKYTETSRSVKLADGSPANPNSVSSSVVYTPRYNVDVPSDLFKLPIRTGILTLEVSAKADSGSEADTQQFEVHGLTVAGQLTGRDRSGDLECEIHWQWNGRRMDYPAIAKLAPVFLWDISAVDQAGRPYLVRPESGAARGAGSEYTLSPVEPAPLGGANASNLTLRVRVSLRDTNIGGLPAGGPSYLIPIFAKLDTKVASGNPKIFGPHDEAKSSPSRQSQLTIARCDYYLGLFGPYDIPSRTDSTSEPTSAHAINLHAVSTDPRIIRSEHKPTAEEYARAIYWANAVIHDAEQSGNKGLARIYRYKLESIKPRR